MAYVRVPDDQSDITRNQFVSLMERLKTNIAIARYRYEGGFGDSPTPTNKDALDDEAQKHHEDAEAALKRLIDQVEKPPLVVLAEQAALSPEEIEVSEEIDKLMEFGAPLGVFVREQPIHEIIRLAVAVLEAADLEDSVSKILAVLAGDLQTSRGGWGVSHERDRPVFQCPRCEGEGHLGGKAWARITCNRCKGLGYLLQEKEPPEGGEELLSLEGRKALNDGKPWTEAQEAEAQGVSLEEWYECYGPYEALALAKS